MSKSAVKRKGVIAGATLPVAASEGEKAFDLGQFRRA
jgi:hypothetical protein